MFPMMGYYSINPFCCGFGMSPNVGFLLGLASATAVPSNPSNNPFEGSLFTNPYISNNFYNNNTASLPVQNNARVNTTTSANNGLGSFGALTMAGYYNILQPTPTMNYQPISMTTPTIPYYNMPTAAYGIPDVNITANNIATGITRNIQSNLASMQSTQVQYTSQPSSALSSSGSNGQSQNTPITEPQGGDLRPGLFKGRLAGQEALVTRICRKYGVSPALVASIIGLESGWGTSNLAMHNNFGGYRAAGDLGKNAKGFGYFSTIEKGLEAMIRNLAGYTRYRDVAQVNFNNLDSIGRHYCEGGVWSGRVRQMYNFRVRNYIA